MWPFDSRILKSLLALESRGLIGTKHGNVENTYQAWLTDAGKEAFLSDTYILPEARDQKDAIQADTARQIADWLHAHAGTYERSLEDDKYGVAFACGNQFRLAALRDAEDKIRYIFGVGL
jgi:hypothetical protein